MTITEIEAMQDGAAEFLKAAPPDALLTQIRALAVPGWDVIPSVRPRVRYRKTTDGNMMLARNDDAGHCG